MSWLSIVLAIIVFASLAILGFAYLVLYDHQIKMESPSVVYGDKYNVLSPGRADALWENGDHANATIRTGPDHDSVRIELVELVQPNGDGKWLTLTIGHPRVYRTVPTDQLRPV